MGGISKIYKIMSSLQSSFLPYYEDMNTTHLDDVFNIEKESYGYPWSKNIFYDCVSNNYLCRVMLINDNIIGYVISSIVQDECHIMNLCIQKEYRSLGYGRQLLNYLQQEVKNIDCKLIFLECRPSNKSALKLYLSEGYNEIGIRKNYYPAVNGYEDAIMLAKYV